MNSKNHIFACRIIVANDIDNADTLLERKSAVEWYYNTDGVEKKAMHKIVFGESVIKIWQTGAYTVHLNMHNYVWDGIKCDRFV